MTENELYTLLAQRGIAYEHHLFTGTRQCHIQAAVDGLVGFLKRLGTKEVELMRHLYGKAINDDITLAALIALHRVNGNLVEPPKAIGSNMLSHYGYLMTIRDDDSERLLRKEGTSILLVKPTYGHRHMGYEVGLHIVHLGRIAVERPVGRQEHRAVA